MFYLQKEIKKAFEKVNKAYNMVKYKSVDKTLKQIKLEQ